MSAPRMCCLALVISCTLPVTAFPQEVADWRKTPTGDVWVTLGDQPNLYAVVAPVPEGPALISGDIWLVLPTPIEVTGRPLPGTERN